MRGAAGKRRTFFTGWFSKQATCRTCGIGWHAATRASSSGRWRINAVVCFGLLLVGVGAGVVTTWPEITVVPLLIVLGTCAIVLPIVAYPLSYTVWQAVDLAMHPPEPGDSSPPPR